MTYKELAQKANLEDKKVKEIFEIIKNEVIAGNKVDIFGFGSFGPSTRAARLGRNPKTGETIQVEAKKAVKFKVSSTFKKALN